MMNKIDFLNELSSSLSSLSKSERDDLVQYYDELIEDTIDRTNRSEDDVVYVSTIPDIVFSRSLSRTASNTGRPLFFFSRPIFVATSIL